jgi:hypothetical protein
VPLNYASSRAPSVSRGPYAQHVLEAHPFREPTGGPGFEEELPFTPPATLPPEGGAVPLEMGAALPDLFQPKSIQASASGNGDPKASDVVTAGGAVESRGGAVPAIHFGREEGAAAAKQQSTSPTARRLPPTTGP